VKEKWIISLGVFMSWIFLKPTKKEGGLPKINKDYYEEG